MATDGKETPFLAGNEQTLLLAGFIGDALHQDSGVQPVLVGENSSVMDMLSTMMSEMKTNNDQLKEVVCLSSVETRRYTDAVCASLSVEVRHRTGVAQEEVRACREELATLQQTVDERVNVLTKALEPWMLKELTKVEELPLGVDAEFLGGATCSRAVTPPFPTTKPPTPRPHTPPISPRHHATELCGYPGRRRPSEFDGKVAWEAYLAQFELLADAQGWDSAERALQLVSSLRGSALKVLGHLTPVQRLLYPSVVEALRKRFGHHQQAEVYRARLKARMRARGEPLPQLAQEMETLVRRAYPAAQEDMVVVLTRDHFVDALQDRNLQLYVKQAHPMDVQEALARALELEAFLYTSVGGGAMEEPRRAPPTREFCAQRAQVMPVTEGGSPTGFRGSCWGCGEQGHMRSRCPRRRRTRPLERPATNPFRSCCQSCGEYGHFSTACTNRRDVLQAGNDTWLGEGAESQPAFPRPRAV